MLIPGSIALDHVLGIAVRDEAQAKSELARLRIAGISTLAGIAVAGVYGVPPDRLKERVQQLTPGKMRGERLQHNGVLIFDDCYNSNPDAVRAMLEVVRDTPARRRIAVLGEMLELGRWAEPLHRDVGNYAAVCGFDVLVGIRGAACFMVDAVKRAGLTADAAFFFDDPQEAGRLATHAGSAGRRHPLQGLTRRACRTRAWKSS